MLQRVGGVERVVPVAVEVLALEGQGCHVLVANTEARTGRPVPLNH